ncbi:MAG: sodium:solute symporter family protein, partial [Cytophagales bacterium]|nr:sodium:solute symporter family protein [Cytophagales bacterium]
MLDLSILDILIIGAFIVFNVIVGFSTRGRSKNFTDYASGKDDDYSDLSIVATIVALFCSASLFIAGVEQMYLQGYFIFFSYFIAEIVACLITIFIYIPKLIYIRSITLHEYIAHFYGDNIRFLFALCEACQRIGRFAIQLIIIGKCASYSLNLNPYYCNMLIWFITIIMMVYSAYGGLKSVTMTDIVQSTTFVIIIPTIALYIWHKTGVMTGGHEGFFELFSGKDPKMTFLGTFSNPVVCISAIAMLTRSALCTPLNIPYFQRILMAKTHIRAQKLFSIASVIYGLIVLLILFIGMQLLGVTGGIDPATGEHMKTERIIPYMLDTFSFSSLRILFLICVISLSISTSDSEFNGISVLLTNDVLHYINPSKFQKTKKTAVISISIIGILSLFLALYFNDIFNLLMTVQNFFQPIVVIPLSMTVLGFRTHKNAIWLGVICGALMTASYAYLLKIFGFGEYAQFSFGPGMIANFIGIMIGHLYYTKIKGWENDKKEPYYDPYTPEQNAAMLRRAATGEWKTAFEKAMHKKEVEDRYQEIVIEKMKLTVEEYEEEKAQKE